jgi:hypothetical protein
MNKLNYFGIIICDNGIKNVCFTLLKPSNIATNTLMTTIFTILPTH